MRFGSCINPVAPFNRDSGRLKGQRVIWAGRASVRAALYMAALVASRRNVVIRVLYKRLRDGGKAPKVVLVSRMRKLLTVLNSMIKHKLVGQRISLFRALDCCLLALYHRHHFCGEHVHRLFYLFVRDAAEVKRGRQRIEVVFSSALQKTRMHSFGLP